MFQKCLDVPEIQTEAHLHLAIVYRQLGNLEQAENMYQSVLQNCSDHSISFELANLYFQQGKYQEALIYFTECIEIAQ